MQIGQWSCRIYYGFSRLTHLIGAFSLIHFFFSIGLCLTLTNALHSVYFTIPEEQSVNTIVGNLISQLPHTFHSDSRYLRFRSLNDVEAKHFHVNTTTSQVSIKKQIDRETICPNLQTVDEGFSTRSIAAPRDNSCQLTFRVNILRLNHSGVDIVGMMRVFITVLDIDDNRCQFYPGDKQHIYINENQNVTKASLNRLMDLDTDVRNNVIKRSIQLISVPPDFLEIHSLFALLVTDTPSRISPYKLDLLIQKPLDYEERKLFHLVVNAGGLKEEHSCTLQITVHVLDENDHSPKFYQRSVHLSIQENTSTSHPIFTPVADDKDDGPVYGRLLFELSPFNSASVQASFYVVPDNGSVFLRQPLNFAERSMYKITLLVRNPERTLSTGSTEFNTEGSPKVAKFSGAHDTMDLIIDVQDVNDNSPIIHIYSINGSKVLTVAEHTTVAQTDFAVVRVTDADSDQNAQVTCTLDAKSAYRFKLTRIDAIQTGKAIMSNDLASNQTNSNGAIFKLSTLQSFDREISEQESFGIVCRDHGDPPQRTTTEGVVMIQDVNDHNPEFVSTYIRMEIVEDSDPTRRKNKYYVVQLNASDKDTGENGRISYSLPLGPEINRLFTIDEESGIIHTTGKLDREMNSTLRFIAMATDNGEPRRSATLHIYLIVLDYNDEVPEFEQSVYEYYVQENVVHGHFIGSVIACDRDFGINAELSFYLTYSLYGDEEQQNYQFGSDIPFRILSNYLTTRHCYEAKLFTASEIDREKLLPDVTQVSYTRSRNSGMAKSLQRFNLELVAEDKGTPRRRSKAKLHLYVVDENDEYPIFLLPKPDQTTIKLSHYESVNAELLQVSAVDKDEGPNGTVHYILGNMDIYKVEQEEVESHRCNAPWKNYNAIPSNMKINLHEYFQLNSTTGKLRLARELPSNLVGHVCIITVLARDMGPVTPLETPLNICITVTDSPPRHSNGSVASHLRRTPQQRTLFYLYIIVGVLVSVLLVSVSLVLTAYCLWYRVSSAKDKHMANVVRYSEGELVAGETNRDMNDFVYGNDGLRLPGTILRDWPALEHPMDGTYTTTTFRPNTPDPLQFPLISTAKRMTLWDQSECNRILMPSTQEYQSDRPIYYTMTNTHVLYNASESPNGLQ